MELPSLEQKNQSNSNSNSNWTLNDLTGAKELRRSLLIRIKLCNHAPSSGLTVLTRPHAVFTKLPITIIRLYDYTIRYLGAKCTTIWNDDFFQLLT